MTVNGTTTSLSGDTTNVIWTTNGATTTATNMIINQRSLFGVPLPTSPQPDIVLSPEEAKILNKRRNYIRYLFIQKLYNKINKKWLTDEEVQILDDLIAIENRSMQLHTNFCINFYDRGIKIGSTLTRKNKKIKNLTNPNIKFTYVDESH